MAQYSRLGLLALAFLDVRGFVHGAPPMWVMLHLGSFPAPTGAELLVLVLHASFLLSLLASAAALLLRSRWAIVLSAGQLPLRLLSGGWTFSGFGIENLGDAQPCGGFPWHVVPLALDVVLLAATAYLLHRARAAEPLRLLIPRRWERIGLASLAVISMCLIVDEVESLRAGHQQWRLNDGSVLRFSAGETRAHATRGWGRSAQSVWFDVPGRVQAAECRTDDCGNYWLVTLIDGKPSVPVLFDAGRRRLAAPGIGQTAYTGGPSPTSGRPVPQACSLLWP